MLRAITGRRYYRTSSHPHNARDSVIITLSCGCEKGYKGSKEPKGNRAYCNQSDCAQKNTK